MFNETAPARNGQAILAAYRVWMLADSNILARDINLLMIPKIERSGGCN
jgi:hypothetical protein